MAKMLLVQCNRLVSGVQYPGISSIAAFVRTAGHDFEIFDTADYYSDKDAVQSRGVNLTFKHIKNKKATPIKKHIDILLYDVENKLITKEYDVIGFSTFSEDWPFTLFLIKKVHALSPNSVIIVGGVHPTLVPEQVIKHKEVDMVCVGEGELALVDLLDSIDQKKPALDIKNLWIKTKNATYRNPTRPLLDFSSLSPVTDWSLYNDNSFYYPFEGKIYRRGSVSLGRGCPFSCSFCINSFYKYLYRNQGKMARRKDLSYIKEEFLFLKEEYNLEFLRFWDETFLSMPKTFLYEFAEFYKREINLPFTIETVAESITLDSVKMLLDMGCKSVSIGVETSNENIRKQLLGKSTSNETYAQCFYILNYYGIRKVANFMFFLPNQTIGDMWNDVYFCEKHKIDHPAARIFYPYLGTGLREYCLDHDLIDMEKLKTFEDEESVKSLDDINTNYITFQDTVLKFDESVKREGKMILDNFVLFQETDRMEHDQIQKLLLNKDNEALLKIEKEVYRKRFKEDPIV